MKWRISHFLHGQKGTHNCVENLSFFKRSQTLTIVLVRPNPPPLSVLVRVMVLRLTCVTPKVATRDISPISMNPQLLLSHDVLLMQSSWVGIALAASRVHPTALATHALKDFPLEALVLAVDSSLVLVTSLKLWLVDSMWWVHKC